MWDFLGEVSVDMRRKKGERKRRAAGAGKVDISDKAKATPDESRVTFLCPVHKQEGVQALKGKDTKEALVSNFLQPISLNVLTAFFADLRCCPNFDCEYQGRWHCPQCRQWRVAKVDSVSGKTWVCAICFLLISVPKR